MRTNNVVRARAEGSVIKSSAPFKLSLQKASGLKVGVLVKALFTNAARGTAKGFSLPNLSRLYLVGVPLVVCGCGLQPPKADTSAPELEQHAAESVRSNERADISSGALGLVERLLLRADALFEQGDLIRPTEDNAYIRYSAVLKFAPENAAAKAGLDAILVNERERIDRLLQASRISVAEREIEILAQLFPGASLVAQLQKDAREARHAYRMRNRHKNVEPLPDETEAEPDYERFALDADALSAKNQELIAALQALAQRLQQSHEFILIYAKNDAQGRWIYKQMREAVSGYRIRGDIRLSNKPHIRIYPAE